VKLKREECDGIKGRFGFHRYVYHLVTGTPLPPGLMESLG
jgi:hypothetical protein